MKPLPPNEAKRLEALKAYKILDTLPEKELDDIARLASEICGTPISLITLIDKERQWFKANVGMDGTETPRDTSFCQYTIMGNDVYEVTDALNNSIFAENPFVLGDPNVRFYAGAPLITPDGFNLGALCVIDRVPKKLSEEQKKSLQGLARFVISQFELRRAKQETENVKGRYHKMIENAGDIIYTSDSTGRFQYVSHAVTKIIGYTPEEITGKHFDDLIPDDWKEGVHYFYLKQFKSQTAETSLEFQIITKDGQRKWVEQNVVIQREAGIVKGFQGIVRDITHRKAIESELEKARTLLVEAMSIGRMGSFENDLVEQKIQWSDEIYEMMEMSRDSQPLTFEQYVQAVHPDDREMVLKKIGVAMQNGENDVTVNRFVTAKGNVKWIQSRVVPVFGSKGEIVMFRGTMQDITDQKLVEKELREAKELAEQSAMAKEQFLANMSHEIRTPMNSVLGFASLILKTNLNKEQHEYADAIYTSGENLMSIINDILDYSKIEAGMVNVEELPFEPRSVFHSLKVVFSERAKQKQLELSFNVAENVPKQLIGDSGHLTQVITNLVGNALKFTETGSVKVKAEFKETKNRKVFVSFTVEDTGIGIPAEKVPRVFERFNQASNDTSRKYGGTGLGLSIVKRLIEMNGGQISLQSTVGKGSRFEAIIPYGVSEAKTNHVALEKMHDVHKLNASILLVEDNILNQKLALKVLSDFDCETEVAENGKVAVEKLKQRAYDLVLMDMQMPEMNGYEATAIIRNELKNNVPIIAMTAHAMNTEKEKCLALGMNDYISKPFQVEDLFNRMSTQLKGKAFVNHSDEKQINGKNGLRLEYLEKIAGGNRQFMKEILDEFVQRVPEDLSELKKGIETEKYEDIRNYAHKLKSSLPVAGLDIHVSLLTRIEELASKKSGLGEIRENFVTVEKVCKEALKFADHFVP